jgi:ketose-bisphosphate aldolase
MLMTLDKMLTQAEAGKYAVIAPDFINLMTVTALIELAEEMKAPLLLSYAPVLIPSRDVGSYRDFIAIILAAADKVTVPIGLHLDHGSTLDEIQQAVDLGFTSVMIDASRESWDVNVGRTKAAVAIAHGAGVLIEAELGHVAVGGEYIAQADQNDNETAFTDPDQAAEFVEVTGIDALAVSVGTIHGTYRGEPALQFERLQQIHERVPVPLVLHGASGTGDNNLRRAVGLGIRKINVFSALVTAVRQELAAALQAGNMGPIEMADAQRRAVRRSVEPYLHISGSVGTAVSPPLATTKHIKQ